MLGPKLGTLTFGKVKELYSYELAGDSFSSSGNDFAGRVTFLLILSEGGATYLHPGVAVRKED